MINFISADLGHLELYEGSDLMGITKSAKDIVASCKKMELQIQYLLLLLWTLQANMDLKLTKQRVSFGN